MISFEQRTLPALLSRQAQHGSRTFIKSTSGDISYELAKSTAARCAGKLRATGVKSGDRVLALCSNRLELPKLWLGTMWCGAALVPINTAFRGAQLRNLVRIADAVGIVADADMLPHLTSAADVLGGVKWIWCTGTSEQPIQEHVAKIPVTEWLDDGEEIEASPVGPDSTAAILYTSGTSGPSKGVVCPHGQFFWWGFLTGKALEIGNDDVLHTTLPLFHTNALNTLWQALLHGATFSVAPRFSASRFWREIRESGATVTYLLGVMVEILLKAPSSESDRNHNLRAALAPATPAPLVDQFNKRFGVKLIDGYGSTETNLILSNAIGEYAPGTMGRRDPHFELRVVDTNGHQVPDGKPGELLVRQKEPSSMATGYFRDPEATAKAWHDEWFHTGDIVARDTNEVYRFVDRLKDSIRRRGENISTWEVEQALLAHPDIQSAVVVGVPGELGDDEVMAFVVPQSSAQYDPADTIRFLEGRLAYFAIPRYLETVSELPKTENGKVKKFLLREQGVGPKTWDREQAGITLRR